MVQLPEVNAWAKSLAVCYEIYQYLPRGFRFRVPRKVSQTLGKVSGLYKGGGGRDRIGNSDQIHRRERYIASLSFINKQLQKIDPSFLAD
jgi:hypothetical protein